MDKTANEMYQLLKKIFPICRSITGNGVRKTLKILSEVCPELNIHEVPSGTQVFDWVIPDEWNIEDAYIEYENSERILDFADSNLHVMGYSLPIDKEMTLEELLPLLHTQPDQPDCIPYVTSYYKKRCGFCMSENQKKALKEGTYHAVIKSSFREDGSLTYGELIIPGNTEKEIFISTNICHPSMANNECSGPVVTAFLSKWIKSLKNRKYTYRIIFIPETIGSLTYLSKNLEIMKKNIIAGFNLTCVGDNNNYSFLETRYGNTLTDKLLANVLHDHFPNYTRYSFLERGSDERQYDAPFIDLPVCDVCRSKYDEFMEYHTSADNLSFVSPEGLMGSYTLMQQCITALEYNENYIVTCLGEPQLGKRGLYPTVSQKGSYDSIFPTLNFLTYADGTNDLIDISNIIHVPIKHLVPIIEKLLDAELIKIKSSAP